MPAGAGILHNHRLQGRAGDNLASRKSLSVRSRPMFNNMTHEPYVVGAANSIDVAAQARWFMQLGPVTANYARHLGTLPAL